MSEIIRAIFMTGGGSFINLLLGIISTKILAVGLGPGGVGLFSLLRQSRDTFLSVSTFNSGPALVQGLAKREGTERKQYSLAVLLIMGVSTILVISFLLFFAPVIAKSTLGTSDANNVRLIRMLTLPVLFGTGTMFLGGVLNGYRAIGRLALVQVVVSSVTLLLTFPVTWLTGQGYPEALVWMLAISSGFGSLYAFTIAFREGWLPSRLQISALSKQLFISNGRYFLSFAMTLLITGLVSTWAVLAVRSMIVSQRGLLEAGIFDVAWTLSMMYLTLVLTSLQTYYLPTLSQCKVEAQRTELIHRFLRLTILLIVPLISGVIVLKPLVIHLLYSEKFLSSIHIIRWMLIGDYLKATSWVFGVAIIAAADKRTLFWTEILWQVGFLALSTFTLFRWNSLEGIGISFIIVYGLYLVFMSAYVWWKHRFIPDQAIVWRWIFGFVMLIGLSIITWEDQALKWTPILLWAVLSLAFVWFSLSSTEREFGFKLIAGKARKYIQIG